MLYQIVKDLPMKENWQREKTCHTLGTLAQMSAEMEIRYESETQFLQTPDGCKIQVFWVPADKRVLQAHGVDIVAPNTMIMCNPNMGYAEPAIYNSEWLNFYLDFGINVVLWNYRGYASSTGLPSPTNNRNDAELVFQWAR